MAEYIEREALFKRLKEETHDYDAVGKYKEGIIKGLNIAKSIVNDKARTPTADVVEVVKAAEILSNAFGNDCPCNFKNIDEWLPYVCEYGNTCDCSSAKCWEQLIKHHGERRCEE